MRVPELAFSGSKRAARSFARWWSRRCRRNGRRGAGSKEVGPGAFSGSNGGEVSERQTAHLEPLGGRGHVLLNSSVVASVRVMYNPAKRWVKQKCCQLLVGGAGERAHFLRRAAAGGCAGAPNSKDEKSPDNCRPRNPRCVLSDLRSETFSRRFRPIFVGLEPLGTFGTQLC